MTLQFFLLFSGLILSGLLVLPLAVPFIENKDNFSVFDVDFDWWNASKRLMLLATFFNLVSLAVILSGLVVIKKWIDVEFDGQRRWRCKLDGLFLLYFLLLLLVSLLEVCLMAWLFLIDFEDFDIRLRGWVYRANDDYFEYFKAYTAFNALNFTMTAFALFMLEKMSRARWTVKHQDRQESEQTTQMERTVAAGWYDFMMVDPEF